MAKTYIKTLLIFSVLSASSCVRESLPECPFQSNTLLFVKDKNYLNTDMEGVDYISEDLPFNTYVSSIYYALQSANTDENMFTPVKNTVTEEDKEINLALPQVPDGEYNLTIWGNTNGYEGAFSPYVLHSNHQEGTDIYRAYEFIKIVGGTSQTQRVGLERAKGKLLVIFNNLPESVVRIDEEVTSIYQNVTSQGEYSGSTYVAKTFFKNTQSLERIHTLLAPTVEGEQSVLSLYFYTTNNDTPVAEIPFIEVVIKRNETTVIAINYNALQRQIEVWDFINGEWTLITKLDT